MRFLKYLMIAAFTIVAALATVESAQAGDNLDLESILSKWANALGGRERLRTVNLQHRTSTVKMYGMDGTVEEWRAGDGRYRLDLNLAGIFSITIVNDGTDYWMLDQNKKVSRQAGQDLKDQITAAYFDTWQHLLAAPEDAQAAYEGTDPSSGQHVVRFLPEGGTEARMFLDPTTFLPTQTVSPSHSGETMTTTYGEWRTIEGIRYPTTTLISDGTPQNNQLYTLSSVTFDDTPPEGAFKKPGEAGDNITFASGSAALDIPIEIDGVHIFVKATLNGSEPMWFVLDTGASVTVVDTRIAEEAGFALEGKVMAGGSGEGKAEVNFIKDASFALPGVAVAGQTVATVQISDILEPRIGRPVNGILGYDLISRFVVEIDYFKSRMQLYDPATYAYKGDGEIVPISLIGSTPHCKITVVLPGRDPIDCTVMIDTGSGNALSFTKPFTDANDLLSVPKKTALNTGGLGVGGETTKIVGRMPELRIGKLQFKQIVCGFSLDDKGSGADATIAGLLGGRVLEQCTVIFDYEHERMILEPNERYGDSIEGSLSGITLATDGRADWHKFTVLHVMEKSPGAKSGIEVGDVIVEINGKPASELFLREVANIFRENGHTVKLTVERNGKTLKKKLKLKPTV